MPPARSGGETPSLGRYADTYLGMLAWSGDLLLFASPRGEVRAFAAATGEPRWSTRLDERTVRFCEADQTVIAVGADDLPRPLRRADGSAAPATAPRSAPPCRPAPSDHPPPSQRHAEFALGERHGITAPFLVSGPAGTVLAGMRWTGTQVPMLVALDGKTRARWKLVVPVDPLAASPRPPDHVLVADREVCASYAGAGSSDAAHLACFASADGRRLWDIALPGGVPTTVQLAGRALLVSGAELQLLDLDTGATRWTFGGTETAPRGR